MNKKLIFTYIKLTVNRAVIVISNYVIMGCTKTKFVKYKQLSYNGIQNLAKFSVFIDWYSLYFPCVPVWLVCAWCSVAVLQLVYILPVTENPSVFEVISPRYFLDIS